MTDVMPINESRANLPVAETPPTRAGRGVGIGLVLAAVFLLLAFVEIELPGLYMDEALIDSYVVKLLDPSKADRPLFRLPDNVFDHHDRFPMVGGSIYTGLPAAYLGVPYYALFGLSVSSLRIYHALHGAAIDCVHASRPPTTRSTPSIRSDIANLLSPSLALLSFASWKTHCDGRAFFIARSVLTPKRPTAAFQKVQAMRKALSIRGLDKRVHFRLLGTLASTAPECLFDESDELAERRG